MSGVPVGPTAVCSSATHRTRAGGRRQVGALAELSGGPVSRTGGSGGRNRARAVKQLLEAVPA